MMTYKKTFPMFELLATCFFSYLSALLFFYPDLFKSDRSLFYENLTMILPTVTWVYISFGISILLICGILINFFPLRRMNLILCGIVFTLFSIAFARTMPNISFGIYATLAVFSFISVLQVRKTEL